MNEKKKRIQKNVKKVIDSSFSDRRPDSAVIELEPIKTTSKVENKDVTIAIVAFNLDEKKYFTKHTTGIFNKDHELIERFELLEIDGNLINDYRRAFIEAIYKACEHKANIICCSEMSFPFSKNKGQNTKVSKQLQKISKEKGVYIIAGTYHDFLLSSCNCCPIFSPHQEKHEIQYKLIPSRTQERHVRSASNMKVLSYQTEFGKFCVSICYDAYSSDVKDLYKYSYKRPTFINHDFIFVPSYNDDVAGGIKHCKNIRDESKTVVFFVNDLSHRVEPVICLSEGGEAKAELRDGLSNLYKIYTYSLNLEELRKSVDKLSTISPK